MLNIYFLNEKEWLEGQSKVFVVLKKTNPNFSPTQTLVELLNKRMIFQEPYSMKAQIVLEEKNNS